MGIYSKSIVAIFVAIFVFSCSKPEQKKKGFTEQEFNAKLDSIKAESIKKIEAESKENLDKKLSIELKPLVDSILQRNATTPSIVLPDEELDVPMENDESSDIQ